MWIIPICMYTKLWRRPFLGWLTFACRTLPHPQWWRRPQFWHSQVHRSAEITISRYHDLGFKVRTSHIATTNPKLKIQDSHFQHWIQAQIETIYYFQIKSPPRDFHTFSAKNDWIKIIASWPGSPAWMCSVILNGHQESVK